MKLGPAARDAGSGVYLLQWDVADGRTFFVSTGSACGKPNSAGFRRAVPKNAHKRAPVGAANSSIGLRIVEEYKNLSGTSGVTGYEITHGAIMVQFQDGWKYLYADQSAGAANILHMHHLAMAGRGLCTFITQSVRKQYVRKWR